MAARYADHLPVLPGAVAAVRRMADVLPVGLASSSPRRLIDTSLDVLGISDLFRATVSTEEVARGKPAPDGYLLWVKPLLPTPPAATPSAGTATPAPTPSESVEQPIQIEPGEQPTPIPPSADPSERGTSR